MNTSDQRPATAITKQSGQALRNKRIKTSARRSGSEIVKRIRSNNTLMEGERDSDGEEEQLLVAEEDEVEEDDEDEDEDEDEEEEEEDDDEDEQHAAGIPRNPANDGTCLTQQELQWAWDIKLAIEADAEIDNRPDFCYAQLALHDQGNVPAALERAMHLQQLREEYKLLDNFQDGSRWVKELIFLMQGVFLSFSYNQRDGNYCLIYDLGALDISKFQKNSNGFEVCFSGGYYFCQAMTCDIQAIRNGIIFMAECSEFDWRKNMDIGTFRRFWSELMAVYPYKIQKVKYFNSGVFINMINSLKKRFLPREITERMEYGCKFEGSLRDTFLVPTLEQAMLRMLFRFEENLLKRYHNERTYELPPLS